MRFLWPEMLWMLLFIPLLAGAYAYALWRKKKAAIRYASLILVRDALGKRPAWRRHVPFGLFLLSMTAALLALARPATTIILPSETMTLILAMDVSRSMLAGDVAPTRINAAQVAVKDFINKMPRNIRTGIVSFAGSAAVVQTPTDSREDLIAAVDRFDLQRGTATGAGLLVALAQLLPEAGIDVESQVFDSAFSFRNSEDSKSLDAKRRAKQTEKNFVPVPPGSYQGGAIVLLSDGRRTTGPDPLDIAKIAADRGVRVYTVGFGTLNGGEIPGFEGYSFFARLDEETLKGVASITGAEYFHAGSAEDLQKVYQKLNTKFALEKRDTEVSSLMSGVAALFLVLAALFSMLWFYRPPPQN
ncbi:MAG TPA: VWA domain-containing protein [Burkholderiales bacterium]